MGHAGDALERYERILVSRCGHRACEQAESTDNGVIPSDAFAACFWITNANNTVGLHVCCALSHEGKPSSTGGRLVAYRCLPPRLCCTVHQQCGVGVRQRVLVRVPNVADGPIRSHPRPRCVAAEPSYPAAAEARQQHRARL